MKPKKPTMRQVATELVRIDFLINKIMAKVVELDKDSHPPREFVTCKECKCKIKEDE